MKQILNLKYGESDINYLDMYLPESNDFPTIIYFHGGGFEYGSKSDNNIIDFSNTFVKNGYGFISVEYSLYSQGACFPDYLKDVALAVSFIKKNIEQYGGNNQIFIAGQSAGAWLALMLCLDRKLLENFGISPNDISGWIIESAQTTSHYNIINKEKGINPKKQMIDEFAPLYYVDENTSFSKMLLFYYDNDMPCRPEQNKLFVATLKNYNPKVDIEVKVLSGGHCFGSTYKDSDGEYPFVKESLKWLNKL